MGTDFEVTMNEYLPLRDVVFNTLRQAILRGELKPGERLMEIQLANKLGVSRTPIREAIRKLELEGLVLMIPRKGAEVAEITEKNLRDVLDSLHVTEWMKKECASFVQQQRRLSLFSTVMILHRSHRQTLHFMILSTLQQITAD